MAVSGGLFFFLYRVASCVVGCAERSEATREGSVGSL